MKKVLMLLSSFALLLTSCSETLQDKVADSAPSIKSNTIKWYGTKLSDASTTRGVSDGDKRWNQNNGISVKFLNSPSNPETLSKVRAIAKEWEEYAGIQFNFVEADKPAPVRVAFDYNGNDWLTWSYTGNDAKFENDQNKPTAVFGGLEYADDDEFRGDVLRLFGQILGLEYEQRHQEWAKNGYWKSESKLQSYWEDQFDGLDMDWDEIREYVFVPLTESNAGVLLQSKAIDVESVMAWPYYSRTQTSNRLENFELSEGDKAFIATLYPKNKQQLPTIQEAWVDAGYFEWTDETKTSLTITELGRQQEYLPDVCDGEQLTIGEALFKGSSFLKRVPFFNTSNIIDFSWMFAFCQSLTDVSEFDTSNGIKFNEMFYACYSLETIPMLDTSNGTNFSQMFFQCTSIETVPLLDTSNGTTFLGMFRYCSALITIPELNTSNGTDFWCMFSNCSSLNGIPDLDTSNGINFSGMFEDCFSLQTKPNLDLSKAIFKGFMYKGTKFANDLL